MQATHFLGGTFCDPGPRSGGGHQGWLMKSSPWVEAMILQKHGRHVFQENQTQKIPKHIIMVIYLKRISGNGWILDAFVIYHPQVGGFFIWETFLKWNWGWRWWNIEDSPLCMYKHVYNIYIFVYKWNLCMYIIYILTYVYIYIYIF